MGPAAADQVLFIFAHQDDEMAAASRILYEHARGAAVLCAYLTDGSLGPASAAVRDGESLAALTELGVDPSRVFFIGSSVPIRDGSLVEHLDAALNRLERAVSGVDIGTVYCLAWEGGHQDHDASHLVAATFAARRGILDRCFEFPLYRASPLPGVFRVLAPLGPRHAWQRRTLALRDAFRIVRLVTHYPSQRRSWLGLFPGLFTKIFILRREAMRTVDVKRLRERPHRKALLYELRFGYPSEKFFAAALPFLNGELGRAGVATGAATADPR